MYICARADAGLRETIKRVLALPLDTGIIWKSHDDSITQRTAIDHARQDKSQLHPDKRRNTLGEETLNKDSSSNP